MCRGQTEVLGNPYSCMRTYLVRKTSLYTGYSKAEEGRYIRKNRAARASPTRVKGTKREHETDTSVSVVLLGG